MKFLPKKDLLTLDEIERICISFIDLGTRKIRITGGEPLVRKNVMSLFKNLGSYIKKDKLSELTLTTNGSQLEKYAEQLFDHGVRRINVSIDTLKPKLFRFLTRRGDLDQVLKGIDKALEVGLKVKINTVALKETLPEPLKFIEFAVISPLILKALVVSKTVAVAALPDVF